MKRKKMQYVSLKLTTVKMDLLFAKWRAENKSKTVKNATMHAKYTTTQNTI